MKSNLGPRLLRALPYIIVTVVVYVALPLLAYSARNDMLYMTAPALDCCAAMVVGYFYGKKAARDPIMPLFSGLLFVPCMYVFYNVTAWVYIFIAMALSFLGECFGAATMRR